MALDPVAIWPRNSAIVSPRWLVTVDVVDPGAAAERCTSRASAGQPVALARRREEVDRACREATVSAL
ncbi:MAG: hypothetical protein MZV49_09470 [Rhodopseudomonas palustris]|nr:hypothetical protein [Rhodopseudomonas palustris]